MLKPASTPPRRFRSPIRRSYDRNLKQKTGGLVAFRPPRWTTGDRGRWSCLLRRCLSEFSAIDLDRAGQEMIDSALEIQDLAVVKTPAAIEEVAAVAAGHHIVSRPTVNMIRAVTAIDVVVSSASKEPIIPLTAFDCVI